MSGNQTDRLNLFVKYLPNDVTDEELYELFSPFGEIVSSKVMIENKSGDSLGYGFVRFTKSDDADRAMTAMNNYRLGNKILMVKPSNPPRQAPEVIRNTNLYVKPLLPNTTEQSLTTLFSPYGKIVAIKVMVDRQTNSSRQIGFVRFSTQEEADAALHGVSGHKLDPSHPPLTVRYAETEEIKQRRMAEKDKKPLNHLFNAYKTGQGMNDEVFDQDGEQGMEMQGQGGNNINNNKNMNEGSNEITNIAEQNTSKDNFDQQSSNRTQSNQNQVSLAQKDPSQTPSPISTNNFNRQTQNRNQQQSYQKTDKQQLGWSSRQQAAPVFKSIYIPKRSIRKQQQEKEKEKQQNYENSNNNQFEGQEINDKFNDSYEQQINGKDQQMQSNSDKEEQQQIKQNIRIQRNTNLIQNDNIDQHMFQEQISQPQTQYPKQIQQSFDNQSQHFQQSELFPHSIQQKYYQQQQLQYQPQQEDFSLLNQSFQQQMNNDLNSEMNNQNSMNMNLMLNNSYDQNFINNQFIPFLPPSQFQPLSSYSSNMQFLQQQQQQQLQMPQKLPLQQQQKQLNQFVQQIPQPQKQQQLQQQQNNHLYQYQQNYQPIVSPRINNLPQTQLFPNQQSQLQNIQQQQQIQSSLQQQQLSQISSPSISSIHSISSLHSNQQHLMTPQKIQNPSSQFNSMQSPLYQQKQLQEQQSNIQQPQFQQHNLQQKQLQNQNQLTAQVLDPQNLQKSNQNAKLLYQQQLQQKQLELQQKQLLIQQQLTNLEHFNKNQNQTYQNTYIQTNTEQIMGDVSQFNDINNFNQGINSFNDLQFDYNLNDQQFHQQNQLIHQSQQPIQQNSQQYLQQQQIQQQQRLHHQQQQQINQRQSQQQQKLSIQHQNLQSPTQRSIDTKSLNSQQTHSLSSHSDKYSQMDKLSLHSSNSLKSPVILFQGLGTQTLQSNISQKSPLSSQISQSVLSQPLNQQTNIQYPTPSSQTTSQPSPYQKISQFSQFPNQSKQLLSPSSFIYSQNSPQLIAVQYPPLTGLLPYSQLQSPSQLLSPSQLITSSQQSSPSQIIQPNYYQMIGSDNNLDFFQYNNFEAINSANSSSQKFDSNQFLQLQTPNELLLSSLGPIQSTTPFGSAVQQNINQNLNLIDESKENKDIQVVESKDTSNQNVIDTQNQNDQNDKKIEIMKQKIIKNYHQAKITTNNKIIDQSLKTNVEEEDEFSSSSSSSLPIQQKPSLQGEQQQQTNFQQNSINHNQSNQQQQQDHTQLDPVSQSISDGSSSYQSAAKSSFNFSIPSRSSNTSFVSNYQQYGSKLSSSSATSLKNDVFSPISKESQIELLTNQSIGINSKHDQSSNNSTNNQHKQQLIKRIEEQLPRSASKLQLPPVILDGNIFINNPNTTEITQSDSPENNSELNQIDVLKGRMNKLEIGLNPIQYNKDNTKLDSNLDQIPTQQSKSLSSQEKQTSILSPKKIQQPHKHTSKQKLIEKSPIVNNLQIQHQRSHNQSDNLSTKSSKSQSISTLRSDSPPLSVTLSASLSTTTGTRTNTETIGNQTPTSPSVSLTTPNSYNHSNPQKEKSKKNMKLGNKNNSKQKPQNASDNKSPSEIMKRKIKKQNTAHSTTKDQFTASSIISPAVQSLTSTNYTSSPSSYTPGQSPVFSSSQSQSQSSYITQSSQITQSISDNQNSTQLVDTQTNKTTPDVHSSLSAHIDIDQYESQSDAEDIDERKAFTAPQKQLSTSVTSLNDKSFSPQSLSRYLQYNFPQQPFADNLFQNMNTTKKLNDTKIQQLQVNEIDSSSPSYHNLSQSPKENLLLFPTVKYRDFYSIPDANQNESRENIDINQQDQQVIQQPSNDFNKDTINQQYHLHDKQAKMPSTSLSHSHSLIEKVQSQEKIKQQQSSQNQDNSQQNIENPILNEMEHFPQISEPQLIYNYKKLKIDTLQQNEQQILIRSPLQSPTTSQLQHSSLEQYIVEDTNYKVLSNNLQNDNKNLNNCNNNIQNQINFRTRHPLSRSTKSITEDFAHQQNSFRFDIIDSSPSQQQQNITQLNNNSAISQMQTQNQVINPKTKIYLNKNDININLDYTSPPVTYFSAGQYISDGISTSQDSSSINARINSPTNSLPANMFALNQNSSIAPLKKMSQNQQEKQDIGQIISKDKPAQNLVKDTFYSNFTNTSFNNQAETQQFDQHKFDEYDNNIQDIEKYNQNSNEGVINTNQTDIMGRFPRFSSKFGIDIPEVEKEKANSEIYPSFRRKYQQNEEEQKESNTNKQNYQQQSQQLSQQFQTNANNSNNNENNNNYDTMQELEQKRDIIYDFPIDISPTNSPQHSPVHFYDQPILNQSNFSPHLPPISFSPVINLKQQNLNQALSEIAVPSSFKQINNQYIQGKNDENQIEKQQLQQQEKEKNIRKIKDDKQIKINRIENEKEEVMKAEARLEDERKRIRKMERMRSGNHRRRLQTQQMLLAKAKATANAKSSTIQTLSLILNQNQNSSDKKIQQILIESGIFDKDNQIQKIKADQNQYTAIHNLSNSPLHFKDNNHPKIIENIINIQEIQIQQNTQLNENKQIIQNSTEINKEQEKDKQSNKSGSGQESQSQITTPSQSTSQTTTPSQTQSSSQSISQSNNQMQSKQQIIQGSSNLLTDIHVPKTKKKKSKQISLNYPQIAQPQITSKHKQHKQHNQSLQNLKHSESPGSVHSLTILYSPHIPDRSPVLHYLQKTHISNLEIQKKEKNLQGNNNQTEKSNQQEELKQDGSNILNGQQIVELKTGSSDLTPSLILSQLQSHSQTQIDLTPQSQTQTSPAQTSLNYSGQYSSFESSANTQMFKKTTSQISALSTFSSSSQLNQSHDELSKGQNSSFQQQYVHQMDNINPQKIISSNSYSSQQHSSISSSSTSHPQRIRSQTSKSPSIAHTAVTTAQSNAHSDTSQSKSSAQSSSSFYQTSTLSEASSPPLSYYTAHPRVSPFPQVFNSLGSDNIDNQSSSTRDQQQSSQIQQHLLFNLRENQENTNQNISKFLTSIQQGNEHSQSLNAVLEDKSLNEKDKILNNQTIENAVTGKQQQTTHELSSPVPAETMIFDSQNTNLPTFQTRSINFTEHDQFNPFYSSQSPISSLQFQSFQPGLDFNSTENIMKQTQI